MALSLSSWQALGKSEYAARLAGNLRKFKKLADACGVTVETTSAADGIDSLHDFKRLLLGQRAFTRQLAGVISPCPASGAVPRTRYGAKRIVKGAAAAAWRCAETAPAAA